MNIISEGQYTDTALKYSINKNKRTMKLLLKAVSRSRILVGKLHEFTSRREREGGGNAVMLIDSRYDEIK